MNQTPHAAGESANRTQNAPYRDPSLPVEERVKDLLGRMTLEEKARQLDMYVGLNTVLEKDQFDLPPHAHPTAGQDIHAPDPEGMFSGDPTHAKPDARLNRELAENVLGHLGVGCLHDIYPRPKLYNEIQEWVIQSNRLGIPALIFEEGLHGYMQFDQTLFPQSINLSSTWNPELAKKTGAAIAAEARACGVHLILGPVLDLARDARWGRIEETFGEDPFLTGRLGLEFVRGMQGKSLADDNAVISEPKHFAGHGSPESGLNTSPLHAGEREMRSIMLKAFEPAVREGGVMGLMAAYQDIDGIPASANHWLLTQVLRDEWGFKGIVIADASAIRRLQEVHQVAADAKSAIQLALNSGLDVQFLDYPNKVYQQAILEGVESGKVAPETLDTAVARVLRCKFMLGLFEKPFVDESLDEKVRRCPEHLALSLEVARQSMILLKNENRLLPLDPGALKSVAVIGPNANSSRNGDYAEYTRENPEGGIFAALKQQASPGTDVRYASGQHIASAVEIACGADVVIMALGEKQGFSGENFDRAELGLPGNQQALLEAVVATGTPVVLVLMNGRPLALPWADRHVPAILEAWYPAEFGGQAIVETLFGKHNPSGRLSVSVPKHVGQVPLVYNHFPSKKKNYIEEDMHPLYAFGHGLSYTTFAYSGLKVTPPPAGSGAEIGVSVVLSNTGDRDGAEVVQVYVRKPTSRVVTPVKALKAFERVELAAGETRTVSLKIRQADLAVWNPEGRWETEAGLYRVMAGGSSATLLEETFTLSS